MTIVKNKHDNICGGRLIRDSVKGKELLIYLPVSYQNSHKRYPVIYMQDGQNLFKKKVIPDYPGSPIKWNIDLTLDSMIRKKQLREVIVVGIFNSGENRAKDYIPYDVEDIFKPGSRINGRGREYSKFLCEEIIPYIEDNYRTIAEREERAIMGSSLGGLISLWSVYAYPELFSMVGALSPCAPWIMDDLKKFPKLPCKIWIDAGTEENTGIPYNYTLATRRILDILLKKGYKIGKDIYYYEDGGADHSELAWSKRVKYPLLLFCGKRDGTFEDFSIDVNLISSIDGKNQRIHINPVVKLDNGLQYSLYNTANYRLEGKGTAKISDNGTLFLTDAEEIKVFVKYRGIEKSTKVNMQLLRKGDKIAN